jgi:hypothetical protein
MCSTRPLGPLRVNRVGLSPRRLLPVFPDEQTSRAETDTSEKCPDSDSCTATNNLNYSITSLAPANRKCGLVISLNWPA